MEYQDLVQQLKAIRDQQEVYGITHHQARPLYLDVLHRSTSEQIQMIITQWLDSVKPTIS